MAMSFRALMPLWHLIPWGLGLAAIGSGSALAQSDGYCFVTDSGLTTHDLSLLCGGGGVRNEPVLQTGDVQVTLRWDTIDDLDLFVTDPAGDTVSYQEPFIPSGGQLDVDANAACLGALSRTPVENIFWPTGQSPSGDFVVSVNIFLRCRSSESPIPFTLSVLIRGELIEFNGVLSNEVPELRFSFSSS
ncbi:MAG: hypothetical protein ACFB0C_01540 [Leptolyngbyaceae cyanobacterium]